MFDGLKQRTTDGLFGFNGGVSGSNGPNPDEAYGAHGAPPDSAGGGRRWGARDASGSSRTPSSGAASFAESPEGDDANQVQVPASPIIVDDRWLGQALWNTLYGSCPPEDQPPFFAILVDQPGNLRVTFRASRPGRIEAEPPQQWSDPDVQQSIVGPLLQRAIAAAGVVTSVLVTRQGAVFALSAEDALAALASGVPPHDPRQPKIRIHPAVAEAWQIGGAYASSGNPLVGWTGSVACVLLWLVISVCGWVWATEIIPRLADAMQDAPVTSDWSHPLRIAVAVAISAIEFWGLLFLGSTMARGVAGATAALDMAYHVWYGWRMTVSVHPADQVVGGLIGIGTALVPEIFIVVCVAAAVRLTPLLLWALLQVRVIALHLWAMAVAEADRYASEQRKVSASRHGLRQVTIIDPSGEAVSAYVYDVSANEKLKDAQSKNQPTGGRRG